MASIWDSIYNPAKKVASNQIVSGFLGGKPVKSIAGNLGATLGGLNSATKTTATPTLSADDYINQYVNRLGIKNTGGGVNLGGLYSAYEQQAAADRAVLDQSVGAQKTDLMKGLERLRQNIAESRAQQSQDYQTRRADLEEAGYMATRANRASAASRGLAGSGLEQLAQLQQMIKQGKQISSEANVNQKSQDALRKTLLQGEEDVNTKAQNLTREQQVALQRINANLASGKADASSRAASANAAANANYQSALQQARQQAASQYELGMSAITDIVNRYKEAQSLKGKKKTTALAEANALFSDYSNASQGIFDTDLRKILEAQTKQYRK